MTMATSLLLVAFVSGVIGAAVNDLMWRGRRDRAVHQIERAMEQIAQGKSPFKIRWSLKYAKSELGINEPTEEVPT